LGQVNPSHPLAASFFYESDPVAINPSEDDPVKFEIFHAGHLGFHVEIQPPAVIDRARLHIAWILDDTAMAVDCEPLRACRLREWHQRRNQDTAETDGSPKSPGVFHDDASFSLNPSPDHCE
jgi:hypothetical protein